MCWYNQPCSCWCANSHRVAKLQFVPHSSQLLLSHFLSLVDAMYGHRVPIFTMKFYGFVRVQYAFPLAVTLLTCLSFNDNACMPCLCSSLLMTQRLRKSSPKAYPSSNHNQNLRLLKNSQRMTLFAHFNG